MEGFEPGSDVIAAGFLLHLAAEHQHPYLYADPDAHRMVEMSQFMAMARYNHARRKDLRDASDAGIKRWCELVDQMLARLPQERPTALLVCEALSPFVKPIDAAELAARRLEALLKDLEHTPFDQIDWKSVVESAKSVAETHGVAEGTSRKAKGLLAQARTQEALARIEQLLGRDQWSQALELHAKLPPSSVLRPEQTDRAHRLQERLERCRGLDAELNDIQHALDDATESDPKGAEAVARSLLERLSRLSEADLASPSLAQRVQTLRERLHKRVEGLRSRIEAVEQDAATAQQWLATLSVAAADENWEAFRQHWKQRPTLQHWPANVNAEAATLERRCVQFESASAWLDRLRKSFRPEDPAAAMQCIEQRPPLDPWPKALQSATEQLLGQVRAAQRRIEQLAKARHWLAQLKKAIDEKNWAAAGAVLDGKPTLDEWPADVLEAEKRFRAEAEKQLKAQEREQLAREEAKRLAQAWIVQAQEAAAREDWNLALKVLAEPPQVGHFPEDARRQAQQLTEQFNKKRQEAISRRRNTRVQLLQMAATALVHASLDEGLGALIEPTQLHVELAAVRFDDEGACSSGSAKLSFRLSAQGPELQSSIEFVVEDAGAEIVDAVVLTEKCRSHLQSSLRELQRAAVGRLQDGLRRSMFSKTALEASLVDVATTLPAAVDLAPGVDESRTTTLLKWSPGELAWVVDDAQRLASHAIEVATRQAGEPILRGLTSASNALADCRSLLSVKLVPGTDRKADLLPTTLTFDVQAELRTGRDGAAQVLPTISFACSALGDVRSTSDLQAVDQAARRIVLEAQNNSRDALVQMLTERSQGVTSKLRIAVRPKRLTEPAEKIRIGLSRKKCAPLDLSAAWDIPTFAFALADGWEDSLEDYLSPAAEKAKKGRGFAIPAAVAAAVVVIVAGAVFLRPQEQEERPGALEQLRSIVASSPFLAPYASQLVRTSASEDEPALIYELPGLPQPERTVYLATRNGNEWTLASNERRIVQDDVDSLTALLELRPADDALRNVLATLVEAVNTAGNGDLFDTFGLRASVESVPAWQLRKGEWVAEQALVTLIHDVDGQAVTTVGSVPVDLVLREGVISLLGQPEALIRKCASLLKVKWPSADTDKALEEVRIILASSPYLAPHAAELIQPSAAGEEPALSYKLPGFSPPERRIPLTKSNDNEWTLTSEERRLVQDDVTALTALLELRPGHEALSDVQSVLVSAMESTDHAALFNTTELRASVESPSTWQLRDSEWVAPQVLATVFRDVAGQPTTTIGSVPVNLALREGVIELRDHREALVDTFASLLTDALRKTQEMSAEQVANQIRQRVDNPEAQVLVPEDADQPQRKITFTVKVPGLVPRYETAWWNAGDQQFDLEQGWEQRLERASVAATVLAAMNKLLPEDHWVRITPTPSSLFELKPPDKSKWTLAIRAPWANPEPWADLPPTDLLPIEVDSGLLAQSLNSLSAAESIIDDALEHPPYWQLLEDWKQYQQHADRLDIGELDTTEINKLVEESDVPDSTKSLLIDRAIPFLHSARRVKLVVELIPDGLQAEADETGPKAFTIPFLAKWDIDTTSADFPRSLDDSQIPQLRNALLELLPPVEGTMTVRLAADGRTQRNWPGANRLVNALEQTWSKVRALDRELDTADARLELEQKLQALLTAAQAKGAAPGTARIDPDDAADLLEDIWKVKASPDGPNDLGDLIQQIRSATGRVRGLSRKLAEIDATIFIEYVTGPSFVFGLAWSAAPGGDELLEGPVILRLLQTEILTTASLEDVGANLLGKVFDALPDASGAARTPALLLNPQIGVVLAPDVRMTHVDWTNLRFSERTTLLKWIESNAGVPNKKHTWSSLADFERGELASRACGYRICPSLSQTATAVSSTAADLEALRWAHERIDDLSLRQ